jgi:hypothetical protein
VSTILKIIVVVVTVVVVGGGVALYRSQEVEVQVQAPAQPPEPQMNIGDIDKLPPVKLPDGRTPAQKAASETKR